MSLRQSSFLFDYRAFLDTAAPLVAALNMGNPEPLQVRVAEIGQKVRSPKRWLLHDKGTHWDNVPVGDSRYQNGRRGHWFLIVMSEFLQPAVSLGYDWTELSVTLHSLQWDNEDIRRVLFGLPLVQLLRPDAAYYTGMQINWQMPYWYWFGPHRSTYDGWLPGEEIT